MFYGPLSLFLQTEPCIVRGPKFKRAKALNINIGGTEIRSRAPRTSQSSQRSHTRPIRAAVVAVPNTIATKLTTRCALAIYYGLAGPVDQDWLVPRRWQALQHLPSPTVSFVAQQICDYYGAFNNQYYAVFPIHDDYFIEARFSTSRKSVWVDAKQQENIENWIPIAPLEELIQQVIASFEVKLSPEAQAQMQRAQAGLHDTSLVKEFAPINIAAYLKNRDASKTGGQEKNLKQLDYSPLTSLSFLATEKT